MTAFLKFVDSKTWKSVISGWRPPTKADTEGGGRVVKTEAERSPAEDELALENDKALNVIFTAVDPNVFKMISNCTVAKEAWEILQTSYEGTAKLDIISDDEGDLIEEELIANNQMLFQKWTKLTQIYSVLTKMVEDQKIEIEILEGRIRTMTRGINMLNSSTEIIDEILEKGKKNVPKYGIGCTKREERRKVQLLQPGLPQVINRICNLLIL
ncbi:hypothetical protein LIER_22071 [Lithospermum erythrorhizon]|uniref:Gag-pol polyprotein n=1 Tax=Lithospermum erythrorhizon TaxID=34254 RepID=A0AAV3QTM2_LITER